jgi:hypothetical protein
VKWAAVLLAVAACSDSATHVLAGQQYLESRDCLGPKASVDVLSGSDTGSCAPACILQRTPDGNRVFVTTTCGPYSPDYDTSGTDPRCGRALAASARDDSCVADAGSTHPLDAGTDAP